MDDPTFFQPSVLDPVQVERAAVILAGPRWVGTWGGFAIYVDPLLSPGEWRLGLPNGDPAAHLRA